MGFVRRAYVGELGFVYYILRAAGVWGTLGTDEVPELTVAINDSLHDCHDGVDWGLRWRR